MGANLRTTGKGKKILLNFQKNSVSGKLDFPLSRADSGLCLCGHKNQSATDLSALKQSLVKH